MIKVSWQIVVMEHARILHPEYSRSAAGGKDMYRYLNFDSWFISGDIGVNPVFA